MHRTRADAHRFGYNQCQPYPRRLADLPTHGDSCHDPFYPFALTQRYARSYNELHRDFNPHRHSQSYLHSFVTGNALFHKRRAFYRKSFQRRGEAV